MGPEYNILEPGPEQCRRLWLEQPILSRQDMSTLKTTTYRGWKVVASQLACWPVLISTSHQRCTGSVTVCVVNSKLRGTCKRCVGIRHVALYRVVIASLNIVMYVALRLCWCSEQDNQHNVRGK